MSDRQRRRSMMKSKQIAQRVLWTAVITCFLSFSAGAASASVCSEGTGVPPFLQGGADPNLLLMIDNSGSMLDLAYTDPAAQCFDDTFLVDADGNPDTTLQYAGNFDRDTWYAWSFGLYEPWQSNTDYGGNNADGTAQDKRVYVNGIIYEVASACTSSGENILDDSGCEWEKIADFEFWGNGKTYAAGTILFRNNQLYSNQAACTSSGANLETDSGCVWEPVDSTYRGGHVDGEIVSYKGAFYEAIGTPDETPEEDTDASDWLLLDEGKFVAVTVNDITTHCDAADGTAEYNDNLCISIDTSTTPDSVTQFVARGNFLNWASASKFDVQKQILTGGKYDSTNQRLISESRGCSGLGFTKQVSLQSTNMLTLRVRGRTTDGNLMLWDQVDSTDDTTRIEILGITSFGFDYSKCEDAVTKILDHGLNGAQSDIDTCLEAPAGVTNGDQRAALNHALQYCWQSNPQLGKVYKTTGTGSGTCDVVYDAFAPSNIQPWYNAYHCYGIYDPNLPHDERVGYVGRCWNQGITVVDNDDSGTGTPAVCGPKAAVPASEGGCDGDCEYGVDFAMFKNEDGYNYQCTNHHSSGRCQNDNSYTLLYEWSDGSGSCLPSDVAAGDPDDDLAEIIAGWSGEIDGDPVTTPAPDSVSAAEAAAAAIPNSTHLDSDAQYLCIWQAMEDYCDDLTRPEVIDPSEEANTTTSYGNIPANLIDAGVMNQLGIEYPLLVMKGYIARDTRPENIIQSQAGKGLRIGAMALNFVGAQTECAAGYVTTGIERYCPSENLDGARVIAAIKSGESITDNDDATYDLGYRRHVDDVAASINEMRATSWTPLGEALFTAIGYFTQNNELCLNRDANGDCIDFPIGEADSDPVQYSCQDNHIILITEGESTADVNTTLTSFIADPSLYFGEGAVAGDNTAGDDDADDTVNSCSSLLGSTFFDDMTWWGKNALPLYAVRQLEGNDKQPILTHVVTTGDLEDSGSGECNPTTLMEQAALNSGVALYTGEDPDDLEANLEAALADILSRASAGSAASVISSSRSGAGAVYQAIFWPEITDGDGNSVQWVGDVHALFLSSDGLLYEDTNGDGILDPSGDLNNDGDVDDPGDIDDGFGNDIGTDKRLIFYYSDVANRTRACYDITNYDFSTGTCSQDPDPGNIVEGDCGQGGFTSCAELDDVKFLWAANQRLREKDPNNRWIFTWNDLNNDGIVDATQGEVINFNTSSVTDWAALNTAALASGRGSVTGDFLSSDVGKWANLVDNDGSDMELDAMDALVSWVRGEDSLLTEDNDDFNVNGRLDKALRSRQFSFNGITQEWRLGDIIHSTPVVVGRPAEAYQFIYRDPTYALYAKAWSERRQTVYFGANDGMLHAVNGGHYYEHLGGFCCNPVNEDGECEANDQPVNGVCASAPDLGEELWAYLPYNLQPHISCLADPNYTHKYYVDQRPRLFDVQIFEADATHVGGWGTILVGSMRFGGSPVNAYEQHGFADASSDNRIFTSAFFVLDVTDPDAPQLLGEMTMTSAQDGSGNDEYVDLNYTTSSPTMVVMKDNDGGVESSWYLILGNGPTDIDGSNDAGEQGRIAVIPLQWLVGDIAGWTDGIPVLVDESVSAKTAFRIPNRRPLSSSEGGRFLVPMSSENATFISDLITVDFDVENVSGDVTTGALYKSDAVYFGTTDGVTFNTYDNDDTKYWNGGGRLFRLVTKKLDLSGVEQVSTPSEWPARWSSVDNDPVRLLIDAKSPITAAPSVGYDGYSFWVYGGTGRFFDKDDKTDREEQRFFGIREPVATSAVGGFPCADNIFTWGEIEWDVDNDNIDNNQTLSRNGIPGSRGLMRTDTFLVADEDQSSIFSGLLSTPVSYLRFGYCYDDDEDSSTPDFCEYNTGDIAALAGVSDYRHIYWPDDMPRTVIYLDPDNPADNDEMATFDDLQNYIAGTGCIGEDTSTGIDGWYRVFHDERERNIGQASLLGGLLVYTGYRPDDDICEPEGESFLYGVHFQTGTAWKENVFGTFSNGSGETFVMDRLGLGKGVATTPSMHAGTGENESKAFIQTSTGEIIEVEQENLPLSNTRSGRSAWSDNRQ